MKVYVLEECIAYEGSVLMGVYSTKESALAAEAIYRHNIKPPGPFDRSYRIREVEIDQPAVYCF
jgi:hypothetical protein